MNEITKKTDVNAHLKILCHTLLNSILRTYCLLKRGSSGECDLCMVSSRTQPKLEERSEMSD